MNKHVNLQFDSCDLDMFSSYVKTTNNPIGYGIKFKGEFLVIRKKSVWGKLSSAKAAFTRNFGPTIGVELFKKYRNSVPRDVYGNDILKIYVEELQKNGIFKFVEVK